MNYGNTIITQGVFSACEYVCLTDRSVLNLYSYLYGVIATSTDQIQLETLLCRNLTLKEYMKMLISRVEM